MYIYIYIHTHSKISPKDPLFGKTTPDQISCDQFSVPSYATYAYWPLSLRGSPPLEDYFLIQCCWSSERDFTKYFWLLKSDMKISVIKC